MSIFPHCLMDSIVSMIAPYMFVHNIRVSYIATVTAFWLGLCVNRESPIHDLVAIQFTVLCPSALQIQNRMFKGKLSSRIYRTITVTRAGVVLYKDNTIFVVYKGKVRYRFRNIKVLRVQNRIEGYLKYSGSTSPRGRTFPGYGKLLYYNTKNLILILTMPKLCRFLTGQERDCGVCSDHTRSKGMYNIIMIILT